MKKLTMSLCFLCFYFIMMAQEDSTSIWQIVTKDGNQFIGNIVSKTSDSISINTSTFGVLRIARTNIKKSSFINQENGRKWPENHHSSRYFFGPNGFGLKKGEGYYQNNWVLFNQVSYGLTDNFSMGVGIVPTFLFGGSSTPIWLTPKFSFEHKGGSIGAGALVGTVIGEEGSSFGILYGSTTFGNRDRNLTIGGGYGYNSDGLAESPTLSLSFMFRLSKNFYLISENYWLGVGDFGMISLGGRSTWTSMSLDYGLILPLSNNDGGFALPWLGISIPFGGKDSL